MESMIKRFTGVMLVVGVVGVQMPGSCTPGHFYDPAEMSCQSCPVNASMTTSADGFACDCEEHSIPVGLARCRPCNVTEVVSSDGRACVPRKCQNTSGRIVCRKCPSDYISVTQNFDGSPMKEVLCVKCARGFKAENNECVRCDGCVCARHDIIVRGRCVPKRFVSERPKYEENKLHPFVLLDIVKYEYLCSQNDFRACRTLADECVKNYYSSDLAGPCRLWIQPKTVPPKGLPQLTIESTSSDKIPGEITLTRRMDTLHVAVVSYTSNGGLKIQTDVNQKLSPCMLPLRTTIGKDYSNDCKINVTELNVDSQTFAPFLLTDGELRPIPVSIQKPGGYYEQRGTWPTSRFRRYFLIHKFLSTTANVTNTVYLRTLVLRLRIQREKHKTGLLLLQISIEAQYGTKTLSDVITTSFRVEHVLPTAGVFRGLEIWGGVLGVLLTLYAVAQWRGTVRRGGLHVSLLPLLAGSTADALYFVGRTETIVNESVSGALQRGLDNHHEAAWFSTLHALAAEAGTLGITLPLSHSENNIIKALVYSAVLLKAIKVAWINWNQCRCDIFFLDWSEYQPPTKDPAVLDISNNWKRATLAREWSLMQTKRRASPGVTVTLSLISLHLLTPWQSYLPQSSSYKWAVATLAWWSSYVAVVSARWVLDKVVGPPTAGLPKVCNGVGLSLLVFQEEYYAHYVHGRNDESDARSMSGPLAACRVACAPQLRAVYKQLATRGLGDLGDNDSRKVLLSRFLAAFFERALDGLSWVASERTVLERLLDVELVARENGNTSTLLYDPDVNSPSCFAVTWWGEEWSLGTFDAMLFGCIFTAAGDSLLAALVTVVVWQIMQNIRQWFGKRNLNDKIESEIIMIKHNDPGY